MQISTPSTPLFRTRHPGYAMSQRFRKRIEEYLGWAKVIGGMRNLGMAAC